MDATSLRNRRGFTQHEHIDSFRVIHMNGRTYDFNLGRFYGVDPFIQFPTNSQSLNPYSYIMNNPLAGTDPTGYRIDHCNGVLKGQCSVIELPQFDPNGDRERRNEGAGQTDGTGTTGADGRKSGLPSVGGKFKPGNQEPVQLAQNGTMSEAEACELTPHICRARQDHKALVDKIDGIADIADTVAVGFVEALVDPTNIVPPVAAMKRIDRAVDVVQDVRGASKVDDIGSTSVRAANVVSHSVDDLSKAAGALDKNGVAAATKAIQSHADRKGGSVFPRLTGDLASRNAQAQAIIDDILTDPGSTFRQNTTGRFGEVLEVIAPDGRGLRFGSDGSWIGVLEPPR